MNVYTCPYCRTKSNASVCPRPDCLEQDWLARAKVQVAADISRQDRAMEEVKAQALEQFTARGHVMGKWYKGGRRGWARATCKHCGRTVEATTYRERKPVEGDALEWDCEGGKE